MKLTTKDISLLRSDAINRWMKYNPEKILSGTQKSLTQEEFLAVCWVDAVIVLLKNKGLLTSDFLVETEEPETDPIAD